MFSAQNDKRRGSTWAHRVTWVTAALPQDGVVIAIHDCSDRKYVMIFGDAFSVVWLEGDGVVWFLVGVFWSKSLTKGRRSASAPP